MMARPIYRYRAGGAKLILSGFWPPDEQIAMVLNGLSEEGYQRRGPLCPGGQALVSQIVEESQPAVVLILDNADGLEKLGYISTCDAIFRVAVLTRTDRHQERRRMLHAVIAPHAWIACETAVRVWQRAPWIRLAEVFNVQCVIDPKTVDSSSGFGQVSFVEEAHPDCLGAIVRAVARRHWVVTDLAQVEPLHGLEPVIRRVDPRLAAGELQAAFAAQMARAGDTDTPRQAAHYAMIYYDYRARAAKLAWQIEEARRKYGR